MQVAPEGTPVRPQPRTQRAAGLAPVAPPVSVTPPLEGPAHGDPEAVVSACSFFRSAWFASGVAVAPRPSP